MLPRPPRALRVPALTAVRGDPLTDMGVLRRVDVIVKGGQVVKAPSR